MTGNRYEEIKKIISEMFEDYNIDKLPIDVFEIAKRMNIKILYASEILNNNIDVDIIGICKMPNSFLHYYDRTGQLVVYINDITCVEFKQRFDLAHEIGHIILGHTNQSPENEKEANFVAEYLLVPHSFVMIEKASSYMLNPSFIGYAFNVSSDVAYISSLHINNRFNLTYATFEYETTINNIFKDNLFKLIDEYNFYIELKF